MISALAILPFVLSSPLEKPDFSNMSEQGLPELIGELTANVESSRGEPTQSFLEAAAACEMMLSAPEQFSPSGGQWLVRYQGDDVSVFTREGVIIMQRLKDGDFPESCGIVAVSADSEPQVVQAFSKKYDAVISSDKGTSTFSTQTHTYRIRPAKNPKSALSVVVRHKE